jgi:type IV secretion system protein VirD4
MKSTRNRATILFMMEEFATLGHMEIMERAAAYFPGFGVKLWAVLQDTTQLERYYRSSWETFTGVMWFPRPGRDIVQLW